MMIVAALTPATAHADYATVDFTVDGYSYHINDDGQTVTVTYKTLADYLYIPNIDNLPEQVMYKGKVYTVTTIGDAAFAVAPYITNLKLPATVTRLEKDAFACGISLTEVDLGSTIEYIGPSAFEACTSLKSITFPASIKYLGYRALENCHALEVINLPANLDAVPADLCTWCKSLKSITVPEGYRGINFHAFWHCTSLVEVNLPSTLEFIDGAAFSECTSLKSIVIPSNVKSIASSAFCGCTNLESITLPATCEIVGYETFVGTNLKQIICYSPVPPALDERSFSNYDATVYVPANAVDTYRADELWSRFDDIRAIVATPDLSGDGIVNVNDISILYDYVVGNSTALGDLNGDGFINSGDISTLYDAILNDKQPSGMTEKRGTGNRTINTRP